MGKNTTECLIKVAAFITCERWKSDEEKLSEINLRQNVKIPCCCVFFTLWDQGRHVAKKIVGNKEES